MSWSPHSLGMLAALVALVMYAAATLVTRLASDRVDNSLGITVVMTLTVGCAGLLLCVQAVAGYAPETFPPQAVLAFCAGGIFSAFLGRWLLFEAVARLGAARASAFMTSSPVFTALFGWIWLADRPTSLAVLAMALTLAGLVLVADRPTPRATGSSAGQLLRLGVASSAAYALGNVCRAYGVRDWNQPLWGVFLGALTGLLLQLAWNARPSAGQPLRQGLPARLRSADRRGLLGFASVAVLGLVAQICTIAAMRLMPVAEVAVIMTGTPLLVFPASYLFMRRSEGLTGRSLCGLALALAGIVTLVARPWIGH